MDKARKDENDLSAGKAAGALLRAFAHKEALAQAGKKNPGSAAQARCASDSLAEAVKAFDTQLASAAWESGGRLELSDRLRDRSETTRLWGIGACLWSSGWVESGGRDPGRALDMARWLDEHGCLLSQRNRKIEAEALQAEAGGAAWQAMRVEAARHWPRMFEPIDALVPGVALVLCALARGWVDSGLMGSDGSNVLSAAILRGCGEWPQDHRGVVSRLDWLDGSLGSAGLGGSMADSGWMDLMRRAELQDIAPRARALLEGVPQAPSPDVLSKIAAIAAVRGDFLMLAAAAERSADWRWMVDAVEAQNAATRAHRVTHSADAIAEARNRGKVSALHAAAMGVNGAKPWMNAGLMALLSIPEARARAVIQPRPRSLVHWAPAELEWAATEAPELLEVDAKGRCVAHEWAVAFGPQAVKRVAGLAKTSCGWMMAQADAEGVTPMAMVCAHHKARDLPALFAGWESKTIAREASPALPMEDEEPASARARRL